MRPPHSLPRPLDGPWDHWTDHWTDHGTIGPTIGRSNHWTKGPKRKAQKGPDRPSVDRTSLYCAWLAGWLTGGLAGWLADPKGSWSPQAKNWPVLSATHILGSLQKVPGRPSPKCPVLSATHILGSRIFEGPQIPKKVFPKAPGGPKPKNSQFYQQLTLSGLFVLQFLASKDTGAPAVGYCVVFNFGPGLQLSVMCCLVFSMYVCVCM